MKERIEWYLIGCRNGRGWRLRLCEGRTAGEKKKSCRDQEEGAARSGAVEARKQGDPCEIAATHSASLRRYARSRAAVCCGAGTGSGYRHDPFREERQDAVLPIASITKADDGNGGAGCEAGS
jgi:hypothetical protein